MKSTLSRAALPALFALSLLAAPTSALAKEGDNKVIATVNGTEITLRQLELAREDIGPALGQVPPEQVDSILLNFLIDMQLLAEKGKDAKLQKSDEYETRLEYYRQRALMMAMVDKHTAESLTDEAIQAYYDNVKAEMEKAGVEEVRARHILLKTEEDAVAVVKELEGGADFAELAKTKSTGPSGPNGGDLGFFGRGAMVGAFEEAAFALEVGKISAPVQTQFGWHVIKLEERRTQQPPALDEVREQIINALSRDKRNELVRSVREGAKVEITAEPTIEPTAEPAKEEPKK
jgi:peptidyl-prolyl cis-trans isomerase C